MTTFENRRQNYISLNKNNKSEYSIPLKIYNNENVPQKELDKLYNLYVEQKTLKKDTDFCLLLIIRILYMSSNNKTQQLDIYNKIKVLLVDETFWLNKNEENRCYWSENHMICYLSSWYLWNQYNNINDARCELLIKTWLIAKMKYFFYECFSQVYNMYTLSALLNIYDFSSDIEIKKMSNECIKILLKQFSEVINKNGTMYCAAGRTYDRCKISSDKNNCNKLMYLLTGLSSENSISPIGAFFATTSFLPSDDYISDYHTNYEKVYTIGHSENDFKKIYKDVSLVDRTIFQWSAGNYFNPENVDDTMYLINNYKLWGHKMFNLDPYNTILNMVPKELLVSATNKFKAFTEGSPLCDINYHIYNHNYYTLTSMENYNRGKLGAQQLSWIANVGGVSVFTQSGSISTFGDLHEAIGNSHLPCVKQMKNVMLVMYNPYDLLVSTSSASKLDMTVKLKWGEFDNEYRMVDKRWYFGEKISNGVSSFIAIYGSAGITEDASKNIYNKEPMQGWAVIMSDENEYKNLDAFKNYVVKNAKVSFKEKNSNNTWSVIENIIPSSSYYYGKITFKDTSFDLRW